MNNTDFWASVKAVINEGFTTEGLRLLDSYAEQLISHRLLYKRFSPGEQHGCATGGAAHVVASLLAAAKTGTDTGTEGNLSFKRESELGAQQEAVIEQWAKVVGLWTESTDTILPQVFGEQLAEGGEANVYDNGAMLVKTIGLDYFIQPQLALDRITLHNAWFPESRLRVLGFGRSSCGDFKVIAEQPFISGTHMTDDEIEDFMRQMGFTLINPRNWTYATPEIYLSDMHDENVIRSNAGNIVVVDCDIRINTPSLHCGGIRTLTTEVLFA